MSRNLWCSANLDDLAVEWWPDETVGLGEGDRQPIAGGRGERRVGLQVDVRLGRIAGITAGRDRLPGRHLIALPDQLRALLEDYARERGLVTAAKESGR